MDIFLQAENYLDSQPQFFSVVFWASVGLCCILVLTYSYLILSRISYAVTQFRRHQVIVDWQQIFNTVRKGEEPLQLPKISRSNRKYLLELWLEERTISSERNEQALDEFANRLHLAETLCEILRPGRIEVLPTKVWLYVLAINAAKYINTVHTRKMVAEHAASDNLYIAAQACACMANTKSKGYEKAILSIFFRFPGDIPDIFDEVSGAGGAEVLLIVQPLLDRLPFQTRMNFLDLAANSEDSRLVPLLKTRLLGTDSDEEIAAILRVLGKIGGSAELPVVEGYLSHPETFVQIQAVRAFGRLAKPGVYKELYPLLSDSEWWLRYRAARAIIKLAELDSEIIESIREELDDRFAKEILTHALEELDWHMT